MADLNALIAQGAQFNMPNPVDQYSKVMQLQQMGQANQLNKLKMDEYTRGVAEQNAMRGVMAQPGFDVNNPEHQAALLQAAPGTAPTLLEKLAQVKKEQAQTGLYGAQAGELNFKVKQQQLTQGLTEISNMSNEADALASLDTHVADGSISAEKAAGLKKQIMAMGFPNWQTQTITGMTDAKNRLDALEEQRYQAFKKQPVVGAPVAPAAAPPMAAAAPAAPPEMFIAKDSSGRPRYVVNGVEVSPQEYQSAQSGVVVGAAPAAKPIGYSLPVVEPTNALAPAAQPDMANALAMKIQGLQMERDSLEPFLKSASAKLKYENLGKQIDNLSKGFSVAAGGAYTIPGVGTFERPPTASEFEQLLAKSTLTEPERAAARAARIAKESTHQPATKIEVNAGQKAEDVEFGKLVVDQYKEVSNRAQLAAKSLPAIDINLRTLDKGFDTGFGTETKAAGASVLAALGVKDAAQYATDAQTFLANANNAVLQRQLEQKGPQTESDAQRISATGAQLGNTKEANKFVLNVAKAQLQRDIDQRKFYSDWQAENKTFRGAEAAWYAGPGGASLFDSPTLKKYAAPAPTAGQTEARQAGLDKIFKKAP